MKKWLGFSVGALLLFSLVNVYLNRSQEQLPDEMQGVVRYDGLTSEIVDGPVDYPQRPPAGGPHAAVPQLCGFYRVAAPDENIVASLATGAVWVAYRSDLPPEDIEAVWTAVRGERDVITTPYDGLTSPVVLTAWERQLALDEIDVTTIAAFAMVYPNREWSPAVDETCTKGMGLPEPGAGSRVPSSD